MGIADDFCLHMGFDGYQSIEPNAGMSMKVMKENYGDKILLMGNVDCGRILPYGTEQEIRDAVIRCIGEGAPGGGFCLTSCNSISGDITAERFMLHGGHRKTVRNLPYRRKPMKLSCLPVSLFKEMTGGAMTIPQMGRAGGENRI